MITSTLKACGIQPKIKTEELLNCEVSLSGFVGMGSKRYVDDLEEDIIEVKLSSERCIREKRVNKVNVLNDISTELLDFFL